ncbi:MAG: outer membrane protein assembly factor BamE [Planctomycetota bacterium]
MSSWVVRASSCCAAVVLSSLIAGGVGCMYNGPKCITDRTLVSQIKEGRTTKDEVRSLLGDPTAVVLTDPTHLGFSKDDEIWKYQYEKGLLVGAMTGGWGFRVTRLTVVFDSSGVVKHVEQGSPKEGGGGIEDRKR